MHLYSPPECGAFHMAVFSTREGSTLHPWQRSPNTPFSFTVRKTNLPPTEKILRSSVVYSGSGSAPPTVTAHTRPAYTPFSRGSSATQPLTLLTSSPSRILALPPQFPLGLLFHSAQMLPGPNSLHILLLNSPYPQPLICPLAHYL